MANYLTTRRPGSLAGRGLTPTGFGGSLFELNRRMNRLFDDLFEGTGDGGSLTRAGIATPALDVSEDDSRIEITAELPGVKEDDIELTVEDGVLTLRGEKRSTRTDEERGYSERSYGTFERRLSLPPNVDEDACSADFKDGVLTITLPKSAEKARGRRIPMGRRREAEQAANLNEPGRAEHQQAASEDRGESEHQPS